MPGSEYYDDYEETPYQKHRRLLYSLRVKVLPHGEGIPLPTYQTQDAAGMDLYLASTGTMTLAAGAWSLFPTGICVGIPRGYEGQVRPRSGLALKQGITVLNAPGTIDADYRGELQVMLYNVNSMGSVSFNRGDRIAQLVIAPVHIPLIVQVHDLDITSRGEGGFGSTGM